MAVRRSDGGGESGERGDGAGICLRVEQHLERGWRAGEQRKRRSCSPSRRERSPCETRGTRAAVFRGRDNCSSSRAPRETLRRPGLAGCRGDAVAIHAETPIEALNWDPAQEQEREGARRRRRRRRARRLFWAHRWRWKARGRREPGGAGVKKATPLEAARRGVKIDALATSRCAARTLPGASLTTSAGCCVLLRRDHGAGSGVKKRAWPMAKASRARAISPGVVRPVSRLVKNRSPALGTRANSRNSGQLSAPLFTASLTTGTPIARSTDSTDSTGTRRAI